MFGESFTTEGVSEDSACIGDRWRVGSVSGLTGLYLAVTREGDVGAGDPIERVSGSKHGLTVADITRVYVRDKGDVDTLRRLIQLEGLSEAWRRYFESELEKRGG